MEIDLEMLFARLVSIMSQQDIHQRLAFVSRSQSLCFATSQVVHMSGWNIFHIKSFLFKWLMPSIDWGSRPFLRVILAQFVPSFSACGSVDVRRVLEHAVAWRDRATSPNKGRARFLFSGRNLKTEPTACLCQVNQNSSSSNDLTLREAAGWLLWVASCQDELGPEFTYILFDLGPPRCGNWNGELAISDFQFWADVVHTLRYLLPN